jgi:hypothetical protein
MSETTQTPGGETFIRERQRGMKIGQRDLYARAKVRDDSELLDLVEEGRKARSAPKPAPQDEAVVADKKKPAQAADPEDKKPDESQKQYEARLNELAEANKRFQARFDREDKEREEAKARAEAKIKEEAEAVKARKERESEIEDFYEVASEVGALVDDKRKKKQLLALWETELEEMPERQFQRLFGDNVPGDKQAENLKTLLKDLAKDYPALFKAAETTTTTADKKPATTGAAVATPDKAQASPGVKEPLNVQKLSKDQYREYSRNPKLFRERFAQGLVEYPKAK